MSVLENLLIAQHNALMIASGYTFIGLFGLQVVHRCGERGDRQGAVLARPHRTDRAGRRCRRRASLRRRSGGSKSRAPCAASPQLLCLDEPAAGLNHRESAELEELLLFIRDKHATSILLIEHDMSVVMEMSDHIVVLDYGEKISEGTPEQIRNDPKVIAAYLGVEEEEVEHVEAEVGL